MVHNIKPSFGRYAPQRERGPPKGRGRPTVGRWDEREREREWERERRGKGGRWEWDRGRARERPLTGDVRVSGRRVETEPPHRRIRYEERERKAVPLQPLTEGVIKGDVKQIRFRPRRRVKRVARSRYMIIPKKTKTPIEIKSQFDIDYSGLPIIFE